MRMRLTVESGGGNSPDARPKYHWVTTIYNPTDVEVKYSFSYGTEWKKYSVEPRGWRWHSKDAAEDPDPKILFDRGPAAKHKDKEYDLNCHRLYLDTRPASDRGEPYVFRYSLEKGWDLFKGWP